MTIKGKEVCFIVEHINMSDMCSFHLNWSIQMKIRLFITLQIEKCYEALAGPPLPPRPAGLEILLGVRGGGPTLRGPDLKGPTRDQGPARCI